MTPLDFSNKSPAGAPEKRYSVVVAEVGFLKARMILYESEIIHLSFDRIYHQQALAKLGKLFPKAQPAGLPAGIEHTRQLIRQLLSTVSEKTVADFETNPFLKNATSFQRRVWRHLCRLGPGETITYGELAAAAGSPGGARAVGNACNRNPLALIIPCHRVVAANGLGGFAGDLRIKRKLLELEKQAVQGIMPAWGKPAQ
ncbi:MAG: methylated-DNA--[protein]-cysteine S-methyltransferase [Desulfurivibrionaceae bacterium]